MPSPPSPPPPPPPANVPTRAKGPQPPVVAAEGPPGSHLVELLVYNGSPFKDHWALFVQSKSSPSVGVVIHATGDVRNGFQFEIKRAYDVTRTSRRPTRIPLQWVNGEYFNQQAMLNGGVPKFDTSPTCAFEAQLKKVEAPGKSLVNSSNEKASMPLLFLHCFPESRLIHCRPCLGRKSCKETVRPGLRKPLISLSQMASSIQTLQLICML